MEEITSSQAPTADGAALSQAIKSNGFVYTWGQTPRDPDTREVVGETMAEQTEQVMENLATILTDAGTSLDSVIKSTVFITDMNDYTAFNKVYESYFEEPYPARSVVKVAGLSPGVRVEIELVAEE
ncbi:MULTISPECIES: Rid family detoxifying hydrolase [Salinibaculum]|uniref:Rid family detoxifying hydrolase n=1 Tax=Salinibaculum TaxID=2732368 RepID=UPI0030D25B1A